MNGQFPDTDGSPENTSVLLESLDERIRSLENGGSQQGGGGSGGYDGGIDE